MRLDLGEIVFLLAGEIGLQGQVSEANHRIHRSPDSLAHVGQEVGLVLVAASAISLARRISSSAVCDR